MVHTWAKDHVKHDGHNVEPMHIFLTSSGGTDKSYLQINLIYNAISKALLYHCKYPEKAESFLLGPTEISAVNIAETTNDSGLGIKP